MSPKIEREREIFGFDSRWIVGDIVFLLYFTETELSDNVCLYSGGLGLNSLPNVTNGFSYLFLIFSRNNSQKISLALKLYWLEYLC
jgi:hypothetical protein